MRSLPLLQRARVALAGAAAALLVVPAAAHATVSDSTSTGDVVLYDPCQTHTIDYALDVDGAASWRLQLQVFDPHGFISQGLGANSNNGGTPTGRFEITFCGSETPGTWTVKGTVCTGTSCLLPDVPGTVTLPDTALKVRRAQTTTALTATRVRHGGHRLAARVDREQPQGFAASWEPAEQQAPRASSCGSSGWSATGVPVI